MPAGNQIVVSGAREHNLKDISLVAAARRAGRDHGAVRLGQVARWRSTRSTPRASAATSSRCRPTRASSSGRWTSRTWTRSRASRRRSRSTRRRPRATRARRSARSPRSTTTCACCGRAWASRTARSAGARSSGSRPSRSSTRRWSWPRARASWCSRRSCAGARASTASCSRSCATTASRA